MPFTIGFPDAIVPLVIPDMSNIFNFTLLSFIISKDTQVGTIHTHGAFKGEGNNYFSKEDKKYLPGIMYVATPSGSLLKYNRTLKDQYPYGIQIYNDLPGDRRDKKNWNNAPLIDNNPEYRDCSWINELYNSIKNANWDLIKNVNWSLY